MRFDVQSLWQHLINDSKQNLDTINCHFYPLPPTGLQTTVKHRTMANQNLPISDEIQL